MNNFRPKIICNFLEITYVRVCNPKKFYACILCITIRIQDTSQRASQSNLSQTLSQYKLGWKVYKGINIKQSFPVQIFVSLYTFQPTVYCILAKSLGEIRLRSSLKYVPYSSPICTIHTSRVHVPILSFNNKKFYWPHTSPLEIWF